MNTKYFFKTNKVGFVLGAVVMVTLTGCMDNGQCTRRVYAESPASESRVVATQDDYIYYPEHEVYYSSNRRRYLHWEDGKWVSRRTPRGVSVDMLLTSPSVRADFHDSPARHHAKMVQKYPKNWTLRRSNQIQKDNKKHEEHEKRDENNGS